MPVVLAWCFVLFFEAYLNDERWKNDYEYSNLLQQYKTAEQELRAVQVEEARLETLDRLDLHAQALGLKEADPGQVEVMGYDSAVEIKRFEQAALLAKVPVLAPQGVSGAVLAPLTEIISEKVMLPLGTLGNEIEQMAASAAQAASEASSTPPAATVPPEAAPPVEAVPVVEASAPVVKASAPASSPDESTAMLAGSI